MYKVWLDQSLIWDKREAGRFPEDDEILGEVRKKLEPKG